MIGVVLEMLSDVGNESEAIEIAKGKNQIPSIKELPKKLKEVWQKSR